MIDPAATGATLPALAWSHVSPWLAAPVLTATHAALYLRNAAADLARLAPYRQAAGNLWTNTTAILRLLKGTTMNPMKLITLAAQDIGPAGQLLADFKSDNKADAVAEIPAFFPLLSEMSGKPVDQIAAVLSPERLDVAFDVAEEMPKLIAVLIAACEAHVAAPQPEVPAA